jgi:enoyl-CoA hydratase/carnithine racemase
MAAMYEMLLTPWMLRADWREDLRPWLWVDLAQWPADHAIGPLPPVPVIGLGAPDHPQADKLDLILESGFSFKGLARNIEARPNASAALIRLLRATQGLPAEHALTAESFAFAMLQNGAEHRQWLSTQTKPVALPTGSLHITREGTRLTLVLDRPDAGNAIDRPIRDALFDAFTLAELDPEITQIALTSVGRVFCIGADLAEFGTTQSGVEADAIRSRCLPAWPLLRAGIRMDVHIQGACIGSGLELACFATHINASATAWFQLPETAMGILPGFGGCTSIPRRIGRQRAALLMLSSRRITASTALDWGLVDAIIDDPTCDQG